MQIGIITGIIGIMIIIMITMIIIMFVIDKTDDIWCLFKATSIKKSAINQYSNIFPSKEI